jgi:tetraacyldisaccharide-1-P 4'-kinase
MPVGLFCGIAHPASFEKSVQRCGARVVFTRSFNDHHAFSAADLEAVRKDALGAGAEVLITTQKDHQRLARLVAREVAPQGQALKVFVWQVSLEVTHGQEALDVRLAHI